MLELSDWLIDYPFAERLYPRALEVVETVRERGRAAILSDGDVVFQPLKVARSGLFETFRGNVLIYIHKEQELADVEGRFPAVELTFTIAPPPCSRIPGTTARIART